MCNTLATVEKMSKDKNLWSAVSRELEEFTSSDIHTLESEFKEEIRNMDGIDFSVLKRGELLDFYKRTNHYLYELASWDASKEKQVEFKKIYYFCRKFKIKKVLDYGGGVGGLTIYLSQRGIHCDYLDVGGITHNFARWRFSKRGLTGVKDIDITKYNPQDISSIYDLIFAYDVLEHIYDIGEAVRNISLFLKEGGFFVCRAIFAGGGLHLAKNEFYQDFSTFNALLKSNGLDYIGRIKPCLATAALELLGLRNALLGIRINKRLKSGGNFLVYKK